MAYQNERVAALCAALPTATADDLRAAMVAWSLTRQDIADLLDVSRTTVWRLERSPGPLPPAVAALVDALRRLGG